MSNATRRPSGESAEFSGKRDRGLVLLTLRRAEHRVSPIENLATGACPANPNSGLGCELSLRSFVLGPNWFQCRIEHARNQCPERQQCVPRLLLHAKARW